MDQEPPYIPYTPPVAPKKERKVLKMLGMTLLLLLLAGSVSYGVLAWVKNNDLQLKVTDEQNKSKTLASENSQLKSELSAKSGTSDITEALPDGSKITYPDTPGNRSILWWNAGENEGSIVLSHKAFQQYLSTVDADVIAKVCDSDTKPKAEEYNIAAGTLAIATKEFTLDTTDNCVSLLASDNNDDQSSRTSAAQVLQTVNADINSFVDSATIEQ